MNKNTLKDLSIDEIKSLFSLTNKQNFLLRIALHDAINRPKGIVPKSAEPFYEPDSFYQPSMKKLEINDD